MKKRVVSIQRHESIDGLIPGVRGQRAFPTQTFRASDPFLMLDHIGPEITGADWQLDGTGHDHPHRGFETITFMFEGRMDHRDSLGNRAKLSSGSVQRMNAGAGIIHGGDMAADTETGRFHELQLWVNNPAESKLSKPDIHNLTPEEIPTTNAGKLTLRVISGELNGLKSELKTHADTQIAHLISNGSGRIEIGPFPHQYNAMVYLMEGEAKIAEALIPEFQLAVLSREGDSLHIETAGPAQLLVLAGKPINEPIAFGGPFVMNTQEEINRAYLDFQQGLFGNI